MYRPLADQLRPTGLDEVVGQAHLVARGALLRRMIEGGTLSNMIFYGPSGVGKTTVAEIAARRTSRALHRLNATTATIADIREICAETEGLGAPDGVLLYLDEIQYFNKKQQQSLLEFLENGRVVLIASTTENPYFAVYSAVLSRSTIFEFKPVSAPEIEKNLLRIEAAVSARRGSGFALSPEARRAIAFGCGGDVRKSVNAVELLAAAAPAGVDWTVSAEDAAAVSQRSSMRYDRDGDAHYDLLSALQKSIRGSDADASVFYLARLLTAGDLPGVCRRLLVIAAEDVGLAYPQAVPVVKACVDAALQLGLPEAQLPLSEAAVLMATAPKSNSVAEAIAAAMADVAAGLGGDVPAHLKDAHYAGAKKLGRGETYRYPHAFPDHWVAQRYLPDDLTGKTYYEFGPNKLEQASRAYWDAVKARSRDE